VPPAPPVALQCAPNELVPPVETRRTRERRPHLGVVDLDDDARGHQKSSRVVRESEPPTVTGVRQIAADHPSAGLTPARLATILREAEDGDPTRYLELAEDMEEKDLHYLGVLGVRGQRDRRRLGEGVAEDLGHCARPGSLLELPHVERGPTARSSATTSTSGCCSISATVRSSSRICASAPCRSGSSRGSRPSCGRATTATPRSPSIPTPCWRTPTRSGSASPAARACSRRETRPRRRREAFFPFLRELVEEPAEIWLGFARHEESGRVAVRRRYVKMVALDKMRTIGLVADIDNGLWSGLTFLRGSASAHRPLRTGVRVFARV
jgi:hypothetical protein